MLLGILFTGCNDNGSNSDHDFQENPEKQYWLDEYGNIDSTEISIDDFSPATDCRECHETHYEEWNRSMHAYSMKDPVFFRGIKDEHVNNPPHGERFCIQCHSPPTLVTENLFDIDAYATVEDFLSSNVSEVIKEGVTCDVCHSYTKLSQTVIASDDSLTDAKYHLYPGEGIKFGPKENPMENQYHQSEYSPIFHRSRFCLPCHNLVVERENNVIEAEVTLTEWNRVTGAGMSESMSCQSCHMPLKANGYHLHTFVGVDIDLTFDPIENSPLYDDVSAMLKSAVELKFGYNDIILPEIIQQEELLNIPISITSLTAHSIPSGTSFNREAWLEVIILDNNLDTVLQSGVVENTESLNLADSSLTLFTSYLIDSNNDTTHSIMETYGIIDNNLLQGFVTVPAYYNITISNEMVGPLDMQVRMLFRSFKPRLLQDHPNLLENLPVFEMASIRDTMHIQSSE